MRTIANKQLSIVNCELSIFFVELFINNYLGFMNYTDYISIDPNIRFGKPCVKNTRITVYDVLGWMASGMSIIEILEDYPELTNESIRACLGFAADREHKLKIAS